MRALGQFQQQPPPGYGYGGYPPAAKLDPRLEIALATLAAALKPTDPGADRSIQTIRDIIVAPGTKSDPKPGEPQRTAKLSDLQPTLETLRDARYSPWQSWVLENPTMAAALGLGGALVLGILIGKKQKG
jgi:hypothetical protein